MADRLHCRIRQITPITNTTVARRGRIYDAAPAREFRSVRIIDGHRTHANTVPLYVRARADAFLLTAPACIYSRINFDR